jgi:fatty acid desaturase
LIVIEAHCTPPPAAAAAPADAYPGAERLWARDLLPDRERRGNAMLLTIGIILFIAWMLGFFAFHVTAGLIHVLLVLAVISFVVHLFTGNRSVA